MAPPPRSPTRQQLTLAVRAERSAAYPQVEAVVVVEVEVVRLEPGKQAALVPMLIPAEAVVVAAQTMER